MEAGGFTFGRIDGNQELLEATYRLRYEVYGLEKKFLDAESITDGFEKDILDENDNSLHFAGWDPNGKVIGTIRLVLNNPDGGFPLEEHCPSLFIDKNELPRERLGEVSRLVVAREKRRRHGDGLYGIEPYLAKDEGGTVGDPKYPVPTAIQEKRRRPVIILGLYRAMYQESKRLGITHWYAAMEKKLWYALKRFSFNLKPIGPEVDYYGPVTPFLGVLQEMEEELYEANPDCLKLMMKGLEAEYRPELWSGIPLE